tara:strand:- start:355 stop:1581 length:1227 start_codon:yes stop_codon:yes gene_type:complete
MIKKNIYTEYNFVLALIVLSFLSRLITVYFVRDFHFDNEWDILLNNLINYKSFSFYNFNGELIPSSYMPPLYPFFLYLINILTSFKEQNLLYSIFFIQILFSTYSVYLFYEINKNFFSNNLCLISSFIFSLVPLNIYACGQISSINLQIFFSLLFLKFLFLIIKKETNRNIIIFGIVSGLLFLTRGEFILIFFLIYFFIIWKNKIKFINLIKILIVIVLVISPYVARNYIHFNQFFLVKSLGYNLWKGNNELSQVEGYENLSKTEFTELNFKISNIKKNKYYEINRDDIFLNQAIKNLNQDSFHYIHLFFKKFVSYYFIDINSSYPNYYNFIHIIPIFLLSILSFPGLFIFCKSKNFENRILSLYLFFSMAIFSIFFILPRYKLAILPIQIILAVCFIEYLIKKLKKN